MPNNSVGISGALFPSNVFTLGVDTTGGTFANFSSDITSTNNTYKHAMMGYVVWDDWGTYDIRKVAWRTGTLVAGTDGVYQISLQDVSTSADIQPDGNVDQSYSAAVSTLTSAGWNEVTLSADRAGVASGTLLAVVIELTTAGTGVTLRTSVHNTRPTRGNTLSSVYTASWALSGSTYNPIVKFTDSTGNRIGTFFHTSPMTALNAHSFNNTSNPKRYASVITPPYGMTVDGLYVYMNTVSRSADFELRLSDSSENQLASVSVDANQLQSAVGANMLLCYPIGTRVDLTAGQTYYVDVIPTTANNIILTSADVSANVDFDLWPGGDVAQYATFSSADVRSSVTTTRRLFAGVTLSAYGSQSSPGGLVYFRLNP